MNRPRLRRRRKLRQLHRWCNKRLAVFDFERAEDVAQLCAQLADQRGRPIHLVPVELGSAFPSGCWISVEDTDLVVFDANTSTPHQEHIIAHELAHMICCHRGASTLDEAGMRQLFPDLDPELVQDMLCRTDSTDHEEQEAEVLATLMLRRLRSRRATVAERVPVVKRIQDSLD